MWSTQWLKDASWRAFRTFCQSLAGLLLAVQTSNQLASWSEISIPWYGYLYSSGVAALISLLQSVDRERAVSATEPAAAPEPARLTAAEAQAEVFGPGCGGNQR